MYCCSSKEVGGAIFESPCARLPRVTQLSSPLHATSLRTIGLRFILMLTPFDERPYASISPCRISEVLLSPPAAV